MIEVPFPEMVELASDRSNGWSIGRPGVAVQFARDADESACFMHGHGRIAASTCGAMRLTPAGLVGIAWDGPSADGAGRTHNLALCRPSAGESHGVITPLGLDNRAVCMGDRGGWLFDLGVSRGMTRTCVRTHDRALKSALDEAARADLLAHPGWLISWRAPVRTSSRFLPRVVPRRSTRRRTSLRLRLATSD